METPFSHYKSLGNFLDVQGQLTLLSDFMHILVTCKYKKVWIKNNQEKVETSFSPL